MSRIFVTQEIGSLQRPIWRQKLEAPSNEQWIGHAMQWGEKLGVEERYELQGILQKDGDKRSDDEKQRIVDISSVYAVKMFETAGLDRVFNGEQPRTEMYDFLARNIETIKPTGTLNSFDSNYYKKGKIAGLLSIKSDAVDFFSDEFKFVAENSGRTVKPCLTGPYTMADWSYTGYYRKRHEQSGASTFDARRLGRRDSIIDFAQNVLNPIVSGLVNSGAQIVQIDEPAATTYESESDAFVEAMNKSFEGVPDSVEKAIHLCYSNYPVLFPYLAECKADSYLVEFTNHASPTHFDPKQVSPEAFKLIELFKEHGMSVNVGVGVVDIHSDLIETPESIRDKLLYAAKLVGDPARVQVNPDCGLRTRKWDVAYAKLQNMVKGAELARAEFGE